MSIDAARLGYHEGIRALPHFGVVTQSCGDDPLYSAGVETTSGVPRPFGLASLFGYAGLEGGGALAAELFLGQRGLLVGTTTGRRPVSAG